MRQRAVGRRVLVGGGLIALAGVGAWVWLALAPPGPAGNDPIINITYPYVAGLERARQIRAGSPRIAIGASIAQVTEILGRPDEVHPLFEPKILRPRRIGTTYWYFLAKPVADGNTDVRVVRVAFDLDDRVTAVAHWGLGENAAEPGTE
jgi:hypothetical protein